MMMMQNFRSSVIQARFRGVTSDRTMLQPCIFRFHPSPASTTTNANGHWHGMMGACLVERRVLQFLSGFLVCTTVRSFSTQLLPSSWCEQKSFSQACFSSTVGTETAVTGVEEGLQAPLVGDSSKVETRRSMKASPPISSTTEEIPGGPISPTMYALDIPYETTLKALRAYHSIHGDLILPRRFRVPVEDCYPSTWYGHDLADTVYQMQWWQLHVKSRPERVSELTAIGFVWERLQPEWNLVLEALMTYSSLKGDLLVPSKFVVPHGNRDWPVATWGIKLGNCVYRIRARHDFLHGSHVASRKDQLDGLGFVWDVSLFRFQKFYHALVFYAKENKCGKFGGDRMETLAVPSTYVVPSAAPWPTEFWGYPLGVKCNAVLQKQLYIKGKPNRQKLLQDIGFRRSGNAELSWLKVVLAAAIYSRMNNRVLNVPCDFIVPKAPDNVTEWPWPKQLWGLPLGQRLKDVRLQGAYLQGEKGIPRRQQLNTLGLVWKPPRGRPRARP